MFTCSIHHISPPFASFLSVCACNKIASGEAGSIQSLWGEGSMWIFDSYFKGCVKLWSRERELERISAVYPPSFYMHLKDPHAHWEMIPGSGSKSAA